MGTPLDMDLPFHPEKPHDSFGHIIEVRVARFARDVLIWKSLS
jgi:hypothetical protein